MFDKEIYNCFSDLHVFNFKSLALKNKKKCHSSCFLTLFRELKKK